jgi:predicted nuclease with TOPRIM domain
MGGIEDTEELIERYPDNSDRIEAYSPGLERSLREYEHLEDELEKIQEDSYRRLDELEWALPDPMTDEIDETFSLSLTRHPTRDRTVIYTPLHRFIERFDDAFQQDTFSNFRDRLDADTSDSFETYVSIWDRKYDGWDEVVWTWSRIADIDDIAEQRQELLEEQDDVRDKIERRYDRLRSRL